MWAYIGYGSISTAWMTLNLVVADPIPRARARMASKANAGCLRRPRAAYRPSYHTECMWVRRRGWPGSLHRSLLTQEHRPATVKRGDWYVCQNWGSRTHTRENAAHVTTEVREKALRGLRLEPGGSRTPVRA